MEHSIQRPPELRTLFHHFMHSDAFGDCSPEPNGSDSCAFPGLASLQLSQLSPADAPGGPTLSGRGHPSQWLNHCLELGTGVWACSLWLDSDPCVHCLLLSPRSLAACTATTQGHLCPDLAAPQDSLLPRPLPTRPLHPSLVHSQSALRSLDFHLYSHCLDPGPLPILPKTLTDTACPTPQFQSTLKDRPRARICSNGG